VRQKRWRSNRDFDPWFLQPAQQKTAISPRNGRLIARAD
jgi:hypothetical protein